MGIVYFKKNYNWRLPLFIIFQAAAFRVIRLSDLL